MTVEKLINNFNSKDTFSDDEISAIQSEKALRLDLIEHFRTHRDRHFTLTLLNTFTELRKEPKNEISIDDLMLASFLVGMHKQVEDCLKIWEAKRVDFDAYAGVDIQLVPFAGIDNTIAYLETQSGREVQEALEYITACANGGDFDNLDEYYNTIPWWV